MFSIAEILGTKLKITVADIGAMPEGVPRYSPLAAISDLSVVGFEPNDDERRKLEANGTGEYLPYVLGTGEPATLHVTHYRGCTSLYPPNPDVINLFETIGAGNEDGNFSVVATVPVATHRLDDVFPYPECPYLKLDVQGAELNVLEHGRRVLASALVVESEVAFVEIYKAQPLFGDIQTFLREQGFVLHKMFEIAGRTFRPVRHGANEFAPISQMLWADAVFVRDFARLDRYTDADLLTAATILHECYRSFDLVHRLLAEFDRRRETGLAAAYGERLVKMPTLEPFYLTQRLQP